MPSLNIEVEGAAYTSDEEKNRFISGLRDNRGGGVEVKPTFVTEKGGYTIEYRGKRCGQIEDYTVFNERGESEEIHAVKYIDRTEDAVRLLDANKKLLLSLFLPNVEDAKKEDVRGKVIPHLETEIISLLEELYPDIERGFCVPVRSGGKALADMSLFDGDVPKGAWIPFDDECFRRIRRRINDRIYSAGYTKGHDIFKNTMLDILESFAYENKVDPIRNLVEDAEKSLSEMSIPELRHGIGDVFRRSLGAYVTGFTDVENEEYVDTVACAWILGGVARMLSPTSIIHTTVPTLISTQQGVGKSKTLEWIAMNGGWFYSSVAKLDSDKGMEDFRHGVENKLVVEFPEAESYTRTSDNYVKAFISIGEDTFRKAYARESTTVMRRYILAMTTNHTELFTDLTGNRRFYPLFVDIPHDKVEWERVKNERESFTKNAENAIRIWAMSMRLYRILMEQDPKSEPWNLRADWDLALRAQGLCLRKPQVLCDVDAWLDTNSETNYVGAEITRRDVLDHIALEYGREANRDEKRYIDNYLSSLSSWEKNQDLRKGRHGIGTGHAACDYYIRVSLPVADTKESDETVNLSVEDCDRESREAEQRQHRQDAVERTHNHTETRVERGNPIQAYQTLPNGERHYVTLSDDLEG